MARLALIAMANGAVRREKSADTCLVVLLRRCYPSISTALA